jgi:PPOX class probable F420-dependent enzyme
VSKVTAAALAEAAALTHSEQGLAVVATRRADNSIQASVVNVAALPHPGTGEQVLAFVTFGPVKLANLRARPELAVTFRRGGRWATVEGIAELAGPDDRPPWLADDEALRVLLRAIFSAAGATHDDWDTYDRVMREQRRAAVLITATRVYGNPA